MYVDLSSMHLQAYDLLNFAVMTWTHICEGPCTAHPVLAIMVKEIRHTGVASPTTVTPFRFSEARYTGIRSEGKLA